MNKNGVGESTPLHVAVEYQDISTVDVLLNAGANVNANRDGDERPIHLACSAPNVDIMITLMRRGADISARDNNGRTPLHVAAFECVCEDWNIRRVDLLPRAGADENAHDDNDQTPMELIRRQCSETRYEYSLPRVSRALERAPEDRAWRRRGTVLMCRTFAAERKAEPLDPVGTRSMLNRTEVGGGQGWRCDKWWRLRLSDVQAVCFERRRTFPDGFELPLT